MVGWREGKDGEDKPHSLCLFPWAYSLFLPVSSSSSFAQSFSVNAVTLKDAGSEAGGEGLRPWRMNEVADDT